MRNLILACLFFMFQIPIFGQTQRSQLVIGTSTVTFQKYFTVELSPLAKALLYFQQEKDYYARKHPDFQNNYSIVADIDDNQIVINPDNANFNFGTITDKDQQIKILEQLLFIEYGSDVHHNLLTLEEADREEQIRNSIPPKTFLNQNNKLYNIHNIPEWINSSDTDSIILGTTYCNIRKINVLNMDTAKQQTLLHELMHVATNCDPDQSLHNAIYELSPSLLKILQENPEIVTYLTKRY